MQVLGFSVSDEKIEAILIPIGEEVLELHDDLLAEWADQLIQGAMRDQYLDPTRPIHLAGGKIPQDLPMSEWPRLEPAWERVRFALRQAARSHTRIV